MYLFYTFFIFIQNIHRQSLQRGYVRKCIRIKFEIDLANFGIYYNFQENVQIFYFFLENTQIFLMHRLLPIWYSIFPFLTEFYVFFSIKARIIRNKSKRLDLFSRTINFDLHIFSLSSFKKSVINYIPP